ncbi:MAG: hypothetical protein CM15mP92_0530 [Halieaceae bacterium]|nr:MAG: hypothetical protein CM15mP92_0530 [Halieaceae bacterium]
MIEDYQESYEMRIFGEEYLKFKHYLEENNFVYIKMYVKEGWKNNETGRVGDPRLQFLNFNQLQDSLSATAKRLSVKLEVDLIEEDHIKFLNRFLKIIKVTKSLFLIFMEMKMG